MAALVSLVSGLFSVGRMSLARGRHLSAESEEQWGAKLLLPLPVQLLFRWCYVLESERDPVPLLGSQDKRAMSKRL